MTDTTTQLAILSDALVKIIDLCPMAGKAEPVDLLTRAGDIAAQALTAAATDGSAAAIRGSQSERRRRRVNGVAHNPAALVRLTLNRSRLRW